MICEWRPRGGCRAAGWCGSTATVRWKRQQGPKWSQITQGSAPASDQIVKGNCSHVHHSQNITVKDLSDLQGPLSNDQGTLTQWEFWQDFFKYILLITLLHLFPIFSSPLTSSTLHPLPSSIPLPHFEFRSMGCTYGIFGFSVSYTILNLPPSILCLPI